MAWALRILLAALDAALVAGGLRAGLALAGALELGADPGWPLPGSAGFCLLAFSAALWWVLAWQEGPYRLEPRDGWDVYFAAVRALLKGAAAIAALLFLVRLGPRTPRAGVVAGLLALLAVLPLVRSLLHRLLATRWARPRALLVGDAAGLAAFWGARSAARTAATFGVRGQLTLAGDPAEPPPGSAPALGTLDDLDAAARSVGADRLLVAVSTLSRQRLNEVLQRALGRLPRIYLLPDVASLEIAEVELTRVGSHPVLVFNQGLRSPFNAVLKRAVDICGALAGLVVLGPLLLLLGLLIRLDSPGPVIYRHRRFGRGRRHIHLNKFRTMVVDGDALLEKVLAEDPAARAEWEAQCKLKNDPRITRVGRVLRKVSLDELPQILNVLKGEMSLVGPRPISELEYDKYGVWQDNFMSVRPGLTGLWQVSGRSDLDFEDRVKLDMYYIRNWSIWLDLRIILKTLTVLVSNEGAY